MLGNVFILGDSYSTFKGYIPDGYSAYYEPSGPYYIKVNSNMKSNENDVCDVEQTWWYSLTKKNGNLLRNCSWSGTTICNTGYDGKDNSEISFIARIEKLLREGYFKDNKVDTFFLFGGTNDSWSNAPLGKEIYSGWTLSDLYNVLPAFSYLINLLVSEFEQTNIYCVLNTGLKPEISKFYKNVCEKNSVSVIELNDIEKVEGHPTIKGMMQIKDQIVDYIEQKVG